MTDDLPVVAVVGPTAVGKTALALRLAADLDGEVISADSRQVYRYMDVGTAKPTVQERETVPHHVIDVVDPDEEYSLALFLRNARAAIRDVHSRSRLPIVVGGSAQYIWGLLEGWEVPTVPPDPEIRRELELRAKNDGLETLAAELKRLDPKAAAAVDVLNPRRVIRALEVSRSPGMEPQQSRRRSPPAFRPIILGLTLERPVLYGRIDERADRMIEAGWVNEVRDLMDRGYRLDLPSMSSVGYQELGRHLEGSMELPEAVSGLKQRTRRFARQQHNWFKVGDDRIRWHQGTGSGQDAAVAEAKELL